MMMILDKEGDMAQMSVREGSFGVVVTKSYTGEDRSLR